VNRVRWWIAERLNRRTDQCWAGLVTWALRWHKGERGTWRRRPWQPVTEMCQRDCRENGTCYCGKLKMPDGACEGPR
jgi:hypothetical protein